MLTLKKLAQEQLQGSETNTTADVRMVWEKRTIEGMVPGRRGTSVPV